MSRATEAKNHLLQLTGNPRDDLSTNMPETSTLWKRFEKVRRATIYALTKKLVPGLHREFNTFDWGGYDAGIHDHKGKIEGEIFGLNLNLKLQGTTIDHQPRVEADSNGQLKTVQKIDRNLEITGNYTSVDGRKGAIEILLKDNKISYQAYYLMDLNNHFELEQVVNSDGQVFDVDKLTTNNMGEVNIPGTGTRVEKSKLPP